jgi:hypothetical protein
MLLIQNKAWTKLLLREQGCGAFGESHYGEGSSS